MNLNVKYTHTEEVHNMKRSKHYCSFSNGNYNAQECCRHRLWYWKFLKSF